MRSMRLFLAAALTLGALAAAAPAGAHGEEEYQTVFSDILLPTRFPSAEGNVDQGFPGAGRRLWLLAGNNTDGLIARVFDVDPDTQGGRFTLDVTGDGTGQADLGIYFYTDMGTVEWIGATVLPVTTGEYDAEGPGGESGAIPTHAIKALVFMRTGLAATFTYRGYTPAEIAVGADGFDHDATVPAGSVVVFSNGDETALFHRVVSDDADVDDLDGDGNVDEPLFDTGPFGAGKRESVQLFGADRTYTFSDPTTGATGSITTAGSFGFPA